MTTQETANSVEKVLTRRLQGFQTAQVKELAATIGKLQAKGLHVDEVFPEGVVAPDVVTIGGTLRPQDLSSIGEILGSIGADWKEVNIFPKGIVVNDAMQFRVKLHR